MICECIEKKKNDAIGDRTISLSLASSLKAERKNEKKRKSSAALDDSSFETRELSVESITTDPTQPRKDFDKAKLEELAESIKQHGVLQPILVRPIENGRFQIVHGERRFQA